MNDNLFALRSSVRSYKPDALPREVVGKLLQAAIDAPSAGNRQPWHFYAVTNEKRRRQLCANAYGQKFIEAAPLAIVVCAEPSRSAERYMERGETLYCLQDTAAAIQNILLCAAQNGLGSCWVGAFDEAAVSQTMELPAGRRPVAILSIGYPAGTSKRPGRRPMEETVTFVE